MNPNPIRKVLSTLRAHRVRHLLMGGQACVFYGAAEFSRDTDIVLLADSANLARLRAALRELQAEQIAVPPFAVRYLRRGHAVQFRCCHPEAMGTRLDVMAVLRGVDSFPKLWRRRTTFQTAEGETFDLLSLPDLVQAKKTQRDKDWPMIRRLLEAHYAEHHRSATGKQIDFWLRELRTPALLIPVARRHAARCQQLVEERPLLSLALKDEESKLAEAMEIEEKQIRELDRLYWLPLRSELEHLRHRRIKAKQGKQVRASWKSTPKPRS